MKDLHEDLDVLGIRSSPSRIKPCWKSGLVGCIWDTYEGSSLYDEVKRGCRRILKLIEAKSKCIAWIQLSERPQSIDTSSGRPTTGRSRIESVSERGRRSSIIDSRRQHASEIPDPTVRSRIADRSPSGRYLRASSTSEQLSKRDRGDRERLLGSRSRSPVRLSQARVSLERFDVSSRRTESREVQTLSESKCNSPENTAMSDTELSALTTATLSSSATAVSKVAAAEASRIFDLEHKVSELQEKLQTEAKARRAVESALLKEHLRRVNAERIIEDARQECSEPFIVPALMDAFVSLAQLRETAIRKSIGFETKDPLVRCGFDDS